MVLCPNPTAQLDVQLCRQKFVHGEMKELCPLTREGAVLFLAKALVARLTGKGPVVFTLGSGASLFLRLRSSKAVRRTDVPRVCQNLQLWFPPAPAACLAVRGLRWPSVPPIPLVVNPGYQSPGREGNLCRGSASSLRRRRANSRWALQRCGP